MTSPSRTDPSSGILDPETRLLLAAEIFDRHGPAFQPILDRAEREFEASKRSHESALDRVKKMLQGDESSPAAGDLLMGAGSIAKFLGISRRQVYRLANDGIMPSFKLGGTVAARRSSLNHWLAELEKTAELKDE